jgi:hypothetical protein
VSALSGPCARLVLLLHSAVTRASGGLLASAFLCPHAEQPGLWRLCRGFCHVLRLQRAHSRRTTTGRKAHVVPVQAGRVRPPVSSKGWFTGRCMEAAVTGCQQSYRQDAYFAFEAGRGCREVCTEGSGAAGVGGVPNSTISPVLLM